MLDDIGSIDLIERIKNYLLLQEPALERRFLELQQVEFKPLNVKDLKTQLIATVLNIDPETAAGRRKLRRIISYLETPDESGKLYPDLELISDQIEQFYQKLPLKNLQAFIKSLKNLDKIGPGGDRAELYLSLNKSGNLLSAVRYIRQVLPVLGGLKGFRFLKSIHYPSVVPDNCRQQFFFRLGLLKSKGHTAKCYQEFIAVCQHLSKLTGESLPSLDTIIGLYSGGEKLGGEDISVCRGTPRCDKCVITQYCYYYRFKGVPAKKLAPLRTWAEEDKPREKLEKYSEARLSNAELLAIIMGTGAHGLSALELGKKLIQKFKSLEGVDNASVAELSSLKGIGRAKALEIKAALELGKRLWERPLSPQVQITSSNDVYKSYRIRFSTIKQELFICLLLDTKNRIIKEVIVSKGGLSASVVHPREVYKEAIRESAAAVIFLHNHPSGDPTPSQDDIALTQRLKEAGQLLGIKMFDHIIIGKKRYFSFADKKMI